MDVFRNFLADVSLWQQVAAGVIAAIIVGSPAGVWLLGKKLWNGRRRALLVPLREEALLLRDRIRDGANPGWIPEPEVEQLCVDFQTRALAILDSHAREAVARFNSDLTKRPERFQPGAPFYVSNRGNWIERRIEALDEIIGGR